MRLLTGLREKNNNYDEKRHFTSNKQNDWQTAMLQESDDYERSLCWAHRSWHDSSSRDYRLLEFEVFDSTADQTTKDGLKVFDDVNSD
jgi:hypothetical protein